MEKSGKRWMKILAKVLSVLLVLLLLVTPMLLVMLSMLRADTIAQVVSDSVTREALTVQKKRKPVEYIMEKLPETLSEDPEVKETLEDFFGDRSYKEAIDEIMESDAAEDFIDFYTQDMTDVLSGKSQKSKLTEKKLKQMTRKHMDELLDIAKDLNPELTRSDLMELESSINQVVDENAADLLEAVPDPAELKREMRNTVPGFGILTKFLEMKPLFTAVAIVLLVLLSAGIFVCLLKDFRCFRCLGVDLLVGGGFNAVLWLILLLIAPALCNSISLPMVSSAVGVVLDVLKRGMLLWSIGLLLLGGALLGTYFAVKKLRVKAPVHMEET